jgi:hypothetical protein
MKMRATLNITLDADELGSIGHVYLRAKNDAIAMGICAKRKNGMHVFLE